MQNQLSEVSSGTRKGIVVEPTLLNEQGQSVPINKFKFKEHGYLGMSLKILQNVPQGYLMNVLVMDTTNSTQKYLNFEYDYNEPFGVYVLHEAADCFVVSGNFKPSHSCRRL